MKRRILISLFVALCLIFALALSSCGNKDEGTDTEDNVSSSDNTTTDETSSSTSGDDTETNTDTDTNTSSDTNTGADTETDSSTDTETDNGDDNKQDQNKATDGLEYKLKNDDTYEVIGIGTVTETDIVIPQTYNGKSVTSIGDFAFIGCSSLTSVTIPNSVTSIGSYAFKNCSSLTSITIPNSVTSIGPEAFYNCSSLTSITIPNSVTSIGNGAFYSCSSLTNATIGNSVEIIGERAFFGCIGLTSVTIPNSVTSIGTSAFRNCNSLTSVTIGNSVTSIGPEAFSGCSSLTSVIIGDSVKSIGYYAFYGCYKLVEVYNLSKLNITATDTRYSFVVSYAINIYTSLDEESKIFTTNDGYIFYEDGETRYLLGYKGNDTELTLPKDCNGKTYEIYKYAFYNNTNIARVVIPDSVTSIGDSAFYGCSILTNVIFENTSDWYVSKYDGETSGTDVDVSNPSTAAQYLKSIYYNHYWYRK